MAVDAEDLEELRLDLREEVDEFDEGGEDDGAGAGGGSLELALQGEELLDRTAVLVFGDEVAEFAENVGTDLDERLVAVLGVDVLEGVLRGVDLELFVVGDDLDDSVPDLVADGVAGHGDQAQ